MDLSFMQNELVLAFCWTLIHSLWQGLLLAVITGAVMIGTRSSDARKRYALLTCLFFLFMLVTVVTFVKELNLSKHATVAFTSAGSTLNDVPVHTSLGAEYTGGFAVSKSLLDSFKDYFNTHASLIVMIWFLIFIARFIRLMANLAYVQRLKHYKTHAPIEEWKEKINELIRIIGIRKPIRLLESGVVKVPVVIGVMKPVILLPLGLLAQLPADEIEAILLHELAHIKRRDYFMNLLQSFVETVFFFNPAIMWLSSMIRDERENCCDDIAISITNSKTKFINALIAFQEYNFSTAPYAVGFPGKKNQLLNRVKRIITDRNKTLNATEKSLLTFGMSILILFSFVAAKKIAPVERIPLPSANITSKILVDEQQGNVTSLWMGNGVPVVQHKPSEKEEIVNAHRVLANGICIHGTIDTVPHKHLTAYQAMFYHRDSISNLFSNMNVNYSKNDRSDIKVVTATRKDGKEYKFKKVDGVLTELFINNEQVTEKNFSDHAPLIADIERTLQHRKEKSVETRALNDALRREALQDRKEKAQETHELKDALRREALQDRKERAQETRELNLALRRQMQRDNNKLKRIENNQQHLLKKNLGVNESVQAAGESKHNQLPHQKISNDDNKHHDYQQLLHNYLNTDTQTKLGTQMHSGHKTGMDSATKAKIAELIKNGKLKDVLGKAVPIGITPVGTAPLSNVPIGVAPIYSTPIGNTPIQSLHNRKSNEESMEESAVKMKNIINDLEKEGIKFDIETSWFGLDKNKFIVDGKKMPPDMHEKFAAKYMRSKNGWGYYYGYYYKPEQEKGRGVFNNHTHLAK
jgi:beta-lactamase regulating signal transducer with metallopeptidase domain